MEPSRFGRTQCDPGGAGKPLRPTNCPQIERERALSSFPALRRGGVLEGPLDLWPLDVESLFEAIIDLLPVGECGSQSGTG
jgi:hypothetical protein